MEYVFRIIYRVMQQIRYKTMDKRATFAEFAAFLAYKTFESKFNFPFSF